MEIEGFSEVSEIITLAKELYDIGRYDIVENHFFDTLSYDVWLEDMYGAVTSVFSGFYNCYDDCDEADMMIFTDDVISDYYCIAWEYGRSHNVPHEENPFVTAAKEEARRWLSGCYSMDFKLLGYTKTRKTAKQSKLIVYVGMCECDCHTRLAYNLVQLYKWFSDKVAEFTKRTEVIAA
ncbi:hypothetical protein FACS1894219_08190 [Clostridia bacterium]|nr:hypothetical protein FACS1894219_08190 [Clostridia bacterium]